MMSIKRSHQTILPLVFALAMSISTAIAQSSEFFPLESLKPGMKGTGKTIFEGTKVEGFEVEILGVLEKIGPQQNLILARLSGEKVDQYGVFAGMSGSPVYIEGKLVGAVAYAFSFATEPIAGITPIQEMIDIFKEHVDTSFKLGSRSREANPADLYSSTQIPVSRFSIKDHFLDLDSHRTGDSWSGQLRPIATPVSFSGFSSLAIHEFSEVFNRMGMIPIAAGSAKLSDVWQDEPLQPGSTLAVQMIRGDMEVSASGTVTHISGDKVYAFGHPFMSVGYTDLPMAQAAVVGVIPSLMNSQKISATTNSIGTIRQDRATGIMGLKGANPRLIPVKLDLRTSRSESRQFNFEVVNDSFLTPLLVTLAVHDSIVSSERSIGDQTLRLKCRVSLKDQPEVSFENSVSDIVSSPAIAAITAAAPVNFIMNSGFEEVEMEGISVEINAVEKTLDAVLDKVWQDRVEVKPGEEVGITVFLRKQNGEVVSEKYPVKIPEGIPPGDLKIMVGDGISVTRTDAQETSAEFIPQNLGQLVKAINNLKKNDRLYIRLFREQPGAVIGGQGLPGLPPSILAIYSSDKTSGDTLQINRVVFVEHELPATDYVLTGQKIIQVNVKG